MNNLLIINVNITYIDVIKIKLKKRFQIINLKSIQYYLNIEIIRIDNFITLRQITYLKKVLKRFDINKCKIVNFLMKLNLIVVIMFIEKNQTTHVDTIH